MTFYSLAIRIPIDKNIILTGISKTVEAIREFSQRTLSPHIPVLSDARSALPLMYDAKTLFLAPTHVARDARS